MEGRVLAAGYNYDTVAENVASADCVDSTDNYKDCAYKLVSSGCLNTSW